MKMQNCMSHQCKLKFAITSDFVDEVELDVVPFDICGIVLGSPYLYDRKAIFFREHNEYHFFKDGIEYIIRAHKMKTDLFVVAIRQMKMLVNASKGLSLMRVKDYGLENALIKIDTNQMFQDTQEKHGELKHEHILYYRETNPLVNIASIKEDKFSMRSFYLAYACSILCLILLLFSCVWIVASTLNADLCKSDKMIKFVNSMMVVFIFVMMSQVILNQASWMKDTIHVGPQYPHSFSE